MPQLSIYRSFYRHTVYICRLVFDCSSVCLYPQIGALMFCILGKRLTSRQSQRHRLSRIVLLHAPRQPPPWLISNVGRKMKPALRLAALVAIGVGASWLLARDRADALDPKVVAARTWISVLQSAMDRFQRDMGHYPSLDEGLDALYHAPAKDALRWKGPYLKGEMPVDPWTHAYRYRIPGMKSSAGFDIWSLGPDGVESEDDVGNWSK
jgi:general secretion pathway protein G